MFTFCSFHKTCREGSQTLRKRGISSFCFTDWNISETILNVCDGFFLRQIYDKTDRLALLWDIWWIFTYNKTHNNFDLIQSNVVYMVLVRSCRRDIFLVAPERCNKGNRRRLHAGKYLTTTHHLTARRSERRSEMAEPRKACPMTDPHFR